MSSALLGHTGFVGSNIARQHGFDAFYNSSNIDEFGGDWELIVIAAAPGAKWLANREPERDAASLARLRAALARARAARAILVSTIDVYPRPVGVDEFTPIDKNLQHPYGRHRLELEEFVSDHFAATFTARLPALFGPGLRKNAIHDLLHDHEIDRIDARGVFQFYPITRFWQDAARLQAAGVALANFATEPIAIAEIAHKLAGRELMPGTGTPALYDMRSRHAQLLGGSDGYLLSRAQVWAELKQFFERERDR